MQIQSHFLVDKNQTRVNYSVISDCEISVISVEEWENLWDSR